MRLLHICQAYWPVVGGAEVYCQAISERLAERGHDVTVFASSASDVASLRSPASPPLPAEEERVNGVVVRRFPINYRWTSSARILAGRVGPFWPTAGQALAAFGAGPHLPGIVKAIARHRADVVMAIPFLSFVMYYPWMARRWRGSRSAIALIPCLHTLDVGLANSTLPIAAMQSADAVLPFTAYEEQYLIARGVREEKIHTVGAGVYRLDSVKTDPPAFKKSHGLGEDPVVLFLGRVEEAKGVWFLIEAMLEVWDVLPSARLVIAGSRSRQTDAIRARASALPRIARDRTLWLLDFPESQKADLLSAADVVALPSVHESFGMAFLEGWLFGKPVVGCRIGAVCSVIEDGEDGLLVSPGDKEELSHAILRLLVSPSLRARLGGRGRRKAHEHCTWDSVVNRVEAVYENIARGRQH